MGVGFVLTAGFVTTSWVSLYFRLEQRCGLSQGVTLLQAVGCVGPFCLVVAFI